MSGSIRVAVFAGEFVAALVLVALGAMLVRLAAGRPVVATMTPPYDLSINKTDMPDPVLAGTDLTYTTKVMKHRIEDGLHRCDRHDTGKYHLPIHQRTRLLVPHGALAGRRRTDLVSAAHARGW